MDIANIDFDNDYFTFLDRFESEYEANSLLDFIEFISIFKYYAPLFDAQAIEIN